ncbi:glycosyl hydrolase [Pelomyxa schiedti]|nr:glycosyl hydrolase [Pelomyxa schiedti]
MSAPPPPPPPPAKTTRQGSNATASLAPVTSATCAPSSMPGSKIIGRVAQVMASLDLESKFKLLSGQTAWSTRAVRESFPQLKLVDGSCGARGSGCPDYPSCLLPCPAAMACTWDPELVYKLCKVLGHETKLKGSHIVLSPMVNMQRHPLTGRHFECFSEDPFLTHVMGTAYVKGVQSEGVGCCLKHLVCNDCEFQRTTMSSVVIDRALNEVYLLPFRRVITDSNPWSLMTSYNKLNGVYTSESPLLEDILRNQWQYDGLVVSDWGGVYSPSALVTDLVDLEMPGPGKWMSPTAVQYAFKSGQLTESLLNKKVVRLLTAMDRVGLLAHPEVITESTQDRESDRLLLRKTAAESIVLLKYDNSCALPLQAGNISNRGIAVIGEPALYGLEWAVAVGSCQLFPHYVVSPVDAIFEHCKMAHVPAFYEPGCMFHNTVPCMPSSWLRPQEDSTTHGLHITYFKDIEMTQVAHSSISRQTYWKWTRNQFPTIPLACRIEAVLSSPFTGTHHLFLEGSGIRKLFLNNNLLLHSSLKKAPVVLEFGHMYNLRIEVVSTESEPRGLWSLQLGCLPPLSDDPLQSAVSAAQRADVAIIFAGLGCNFEGEGLDRTRYELPGKQDELISKVAAVNPNTFVVVVGGGPVDMTKWWNKVPAIFHACYLGQEYGNAISDVLFGTVNPCGKLPFSIPMSIRDTPAFTSFPGENSEILYCEGEFIGYRWYDKRRIQPLCAFGSGLSYTQFKLQNLLYPETVAQNSASIPISLEVLNVGKYGGNHVVQVYTKIPSSRLVRQLVAFTKVNVPPGQSQRITIYIDTRDLATYRKGLGWAVLPGPYKMYIGSSSVITPCTLKTTITLN